MANKRCILNVLLCLLSAYIITYMYLFSQGSIMVLNTLHQVHRGNNTVIWDKLLLRDVKEACSF